MAISRNAGPLLASPSGQQLELSNRSAGVSITLQFCAGHDGERNRAVHSEERGIGSKLLWDHR